VERVLLSRHAESELSAIGIVNGDPSRRCGLTRAGEEQARELGRSLSQEPVDLAVTSDFERCRLTARIALRGRRPSWLELPDLGDIRVGELEGIRLAELRAWMHAHGSLEAPPAGENRVHVATRLARGLRSILERNERVALVVSHGLPVRYALESVAGRHPPRVVEPIPYATAFPLSAAELELAAARLEAWAAAPDW
jgi:broad specificity phosphatase PhoE